MCGESTDLVVGWLGAAQRRWDDQRQDSWRLVARRTMTACDLEASGQTRVLTNRPAGKSSCCWFRRDSE
jgi:hypothetical protein